jgi:hypothetical protein
VDPSNKLQVELRVVPVQVIKGPPGTKPTIVKKTLPEGAGPIHLEENDNFMLELRNRGKQPVFVTVIDLQPGGLIAPMFPNPRFNSTVIENLIDVGDTWHQVAYPYIFKVTKPFGPELLKAIATLEPADFSSISTTRDMHERGVVHPLARMLMESNQGSRGVGLDVEITDWTTGELTMVTGPKAEASQPPQ